MKLHINPFKLFFNLVLVATLLIVVIERRVDGARIEKPFTHFALSLWFACIGPTLMVSALNERVSEHAGSIWKKSWPATFLLGVLSLFGGVAKLWKILGA